MKNILLIIIVLQFQYKMPIKVNDKLSLSDVKELIYKHAPNEHIAEGTYLMCILETGWLKSKLATEHNNLFGHKDPGGINYLTTEYRKGNYVKERWGFKTYTSYDECINYHFEVFLKKDRYSEAMRSETMLEFIIELGNADYYTDPNYASKILKIKKAVAKKTTALKYSHKKYRTKI